MTRALSDDPEALRHELEEALANSAGTKAREGGEQYCPEPLSGCIELHSRSAHCGGCDIGPRCPGFRMIDRQEWAQAQPHIEAALAYAGDTHEIQDIQEACLIGEAHLWTSENSAASN